MDMLRAYIAVVATVIPNTGYLIVDKLATTVDGFYFYCWTQPPWINEARDKFFTFLLLLANFMQGYASYLVFRDRGRFQDVTVPLTAFASELVLFWVYCVTFLRLQSIKWSLVLLIMTFIVTSGTTILFWSSSHRAGHLMLPYLAWLMHACSRDYWRYRNFHSTSAGYPRDISDDVSSSEAMDGQLAQSPSSLKIANRRATGYYKGKSVKVSPVKVKNANAPQECSSKEPIGKEPSLPFVEDVNATKHPPNAIEHPANTTKHPKNAPQKSESSASKSEEPGKDRPKMGYNPKTPNK